MIDLYALTSPNVQKIFIALEELQLPYRPIYVDVWKGEHFGDEFSSINPNRKIPAIVDHDGPGGKPHTVIESGAMTDSGKPLYAFEPLTLAPLDISLIESALLTAKERAWLLAYHARIAEILNPQLTSPEKGWLASLPTALAG